ncbi:MAG: sugar kinase [Chitinophagaceae bacterium]|nr:sugar kinase [Chitinophagaceae bacterium]
MEKYDIVIALDLCVDFVIDLGKTEPEFGQKEKLVKDYSLELGGSNTIFASQVVKLGLKTAGIGKVGNDLFGKIIIDKLTTAGVITDFIQIDSNIKTGVGVALCKINDRAILTYTGSIDALGLNDYTAKLIESTRHIHIGSFYLMKKLQPHYLHILKKAKKNNVTISLDTNWDPEERWENGIKQILPLVDILFANENEAIGLSKMSNMKKALKNLSDIVPIVVIKKGAKGSIVLYNGKRSVVSALQVDVKDTVGAGDSFDAGFVYSFLIGYSMQKCQTIANICGSLSTTQPGGILGQPDIGLIKKYL